MAEKRDCGHNYYGECEQRRIYRRLVAFFLLLIALVLLAVLVVWLVLRPTGPRFYLHDASLVQLNLTADAAFLTSVLHVTLSSRNPNDRIGVYYDRLVAYGRYHRQQITTATVLPAGYQSRQERTVWSPYLFGGAVPLAPDLAGALLQDQQAGYVLLSVRVDGRLRWKVGTWVSGRYHLHVNCPALLVLDAGAYKYEFQHNTRCSVDI
ncbi:NDR1/HIN1-like protein 1 [Curcuma longa]|uniref:NDR1/HIN1-like protein 1 n=1 Tax=Curcuma longa TaxID=136217 RepID=UPI003D9E0DA7